MPITTSQSPVEPLISLVFCEGASIARGRHCSAVRLRVCRAHGKPRLRGQPATTDLPRKQRSARAFRRAERTETGQDLDQRAVIAELLRAPVGLRIALEGADRAGIHRLLLDRAGPGGSFIGLIALANAAGTL